MLLRKPVSFIIIRPRDLVSSNQTYTKACGNRTLEPYTTPFRTPLTKLRTGAKSGFVTRVSRRDCSLLELYIGPRRLHVVSYHKRIHDRSKGPRQEVGSAVSLFHQNKRSKSRENHGLLNNGKAKGF